jgi:hypothetical protein
MSASGEGGIGGLPRRSDRMEIVTETIGLARLREMAEQRFGDMVKAVVDIEKRVMAVDAELHADEEELLLEQGSAQASLWGINIYPDASEEDWIEFDSMINLRPSQGNRSRGVDDPIRRQKILEIVSRLVRR